MSLENIYYVGQTIAVVAILGSLIALIYQLRQATRTIYETPGLADILLRGNAGLDALNDADRLRYITFCVSSFRIWEGLHAQFVDGRIDPELWDMHINELRAQRDFAGSRQVWAFRGPSFSKAFQAFMTTLETQTYDGELHDIKPSAKKQT